MYYLRLIGCLLIGISFTTRMHGQIIWLEDFNDLPNGTTVDNGATAWSLDLTTFCGGSVSGSFDVQASRLVANDTDCDARWLSEWIDISAYPSVDLYAILDGAGTLDAGGSNPDTCKIGYRIDGGLAVTWLDEYAGASVINSVSCGGTVSGDSIQIVVQSSTTGGDEYHYIDDITLSVSNALPSGTDTLYSRQSGNWNDTSTWSTTPNGTSCGCTPNANSRVFITCGEIVSVTADADAKEVHVLFGGRIQWTNADVELNLHDDAVLSVSNGAAVNQNGQTNAAIEFEGTGNCTVTVNDDSTGIDMDRINVNTPVDLVIQGSGRIHLTDHFLISASGVSVVNNLATQLFIQNNFIINGDTLTMTNNGYIYINNQFDLNASYLNLTNNDSIYIQADFDGNNADNGQFTNASTGWVYINGDDFELSENSDNFRVDNFGVFVIVDDLKESGTGAVACEWHNRAGGYLYLGHNDSEVDWNIYAGYSGNTIDYFRNGNQNFVFTPQDAYWNLTLSGSGNKITLSDLDIDGDVLITGSARFDPNNGNDNLSVAGNWTVNSTNGLPFDYGTEQVTFDGNGRQTISGSADIQFYTLHVNKSDTLKASAPVSIVTGGSVVFSAGHIRSDAINLIIIEDNATVSGATNSSYVDGPVRKVGDEGFEFPIGDAGNLQPAAISAPVNTTDAFTATYLYRDPRLSYDPNSKENSIHHLSTEEYWVLDRTSGTSAVTVTLNFDAASGGVTDIDSLIVARWNGSQWVNHGNGGTTGNTTAGSVTSAGAVAAFSPFTLGSVTDWWSSNPLPVQLLSLSAECKASDKLNIEWEVASEHDVDHYLLEAYRNSIWERLDRVDARNQMSYNRYHVEIDVDLVSEIRLTEVTFDGTETMLSTVSTGCNENSIGSLVYPNPFGRVLRVLPSSDYKTEGDVIIYDVCAYRVFESTISSGVEQLDLAQLSPGIYFLVLTDNSGNSERFTICRK
ncbi:MAG: hypothetical protein Kow0075_06340 [Salibacteraceae bacterium]